VKRERERAIQRGCIGNKGMSEQTVESEIVNETGNRQNTNSGKRQNLPNRSSADLYSNNLFVVRIVENPCGSLEIDGYEKGTGGGKDTEKRRR